MYLTLPNNTTWLECTSQDAPFCYLGTFTEDRMAWHARKAEIIPELKNRTLRAYIKRGYTDEDEITYTLPENQVIESAPIPLKVISL